MTVALFCAGYTIVWTFSDPVSHHTLLSNYCSYGDKTEDDFKDEVKRSKLSY